MRDKSLPYDIVFLDCPGHIFEYEDEARSVLSKAHFILHIVNERQEEVIPYNSNYEDENKWNLKLTSLLVRKLDIIELHSHSLIDDIFHYDADGIKTDKFDGIFDEIRRFVADKGYQPVDALETAIRIVKQTCENIKEPKVAMCSFGKDSIAML